MTATELQAPVVPIIMIMMMMMTVITMTIMTRMRMFWAAAALAQAPCHALVLLEVEAAVPVLVQLLATARQLAGGTRMEWAASVRESPSSSAPRPAAAPAGQAAAAL